MKALDIKMIRVAWLMNALVMFVVPLLACSQPRSDVAQLGPAELAQEVRSALAEPAYLDRNARLTSALRQLAPGNVDAVVDVYTELLKDLREAELEPLFDAWANFDPPAAVAYSLTVPYEGVSQFAQRSAIYSWAVRDALAARVAADQAAAGQRRNALLFYQALIQGWAVSGQDGLEDYILSGAGFEDPGQLILAAQPKIYLRDGVDGLLEWSETMVQKASDYGARMKAFRYAVRTAGFRHPHAAMPFVERHYGEDYAKEGPRVLADTWAHKDPEAALAWVRESAPEDARASALGMVVGSWLARDREAARSWIDAAPVGEPYYQPAFDKVANRIAKHDPTQAIEWCQRGQTPEINSTCLRQVAMAWYRKDPVAAGLWMEEDSGLSVEDMAKVRQRVAKGGKKKKMQ